MEEKTIVCEVHASRSLRHVRRLAVGPPHHDAAVTDGCVALPTRVRVCQVVHGRFSDDAGGVTDVDGGVTDLDTDEAQPWYAMHLRRSACETAVASAGHGTSWCPRVYGRAMQVVLWGCMPLGGSMEFYR